MRKEGQSWEMEGRGSLGAQGMPEESKPRFYGLSHWNT